MDAERTVIERWRSLATSYNAIAGRLDRALQEGHGLTLSEFETLERLVELGCDKQRMQEVSARMYLSQSALSRTVGRLEKQGLVERALCTADRRGIFVKITEAGQARHAAALATHRAIVADQLGADAALS
ncbi:MarR family winged helix-turn-helix transcriptional regulator [Actinomadura flavalba]|uniref:MarR family winged helix-turn-helix transcriptional regulator n=1 Tax=Actinomadura flavalba TaxID=1120938 RepID=UPI00047806B7|nr:MarR family transcriptional regulator [Actinomadura flavalba]